MQGRRPSAKRPFRIRTFHPSQLSRASDELQWPREVQLAQGESVPKRAEDASVDLGRGGDMLRSGHKDEEAWEEEQPAGRVQCWTSAGGALQDAGRQATPRLQEDEKVSSPTRSLLSYLLPTVKTLKITSRSHYF